LSQPGAHRVFISAGERSGDIHASNLIRALRAIRPEIEFEGFGGPRMAEAGCRIHRDMLDLAVMWTSFIGHLAKFLALIRRFYWLLRERPPRAMILVDFPGLHFVFARLARARGIPVVYYICPQIWAWAPWRRGKILRLTDLLMVILPFEVALYRNPRVPAVNVGHPLADELLARAAEPEGAALRERLARRAGTKIIGIFPGSRRQEVYSLLPLFRGILDRMGLDGARHRILVSASRAEFRAPIEESLRGLAAPVSIEEGDARPLMAACDFAIVASGTASLEIAWYGKPMIVLYRVSRFQMAAYRLLGVNPFISLVNILGGEEVVPERVVVSSEPGDLPDIARDLLEDTPGRAACLERIARMRERAFLPGGVERAASTLARFLEEKAGMKTPAGSER
jgi:lipid-A-disaccharide synthase